MRIGELAAATGVSVRSLRYYEEQGLLASARSASGQRRYTPDAIPRVETIQRMYAAGLCSTKINELLPCLEAAPEQRTAHLLESLRAERSRIDASIDDLLHVRATLDGVIETLQLEAGAAA